MHWPNMRQLLSPEKRKSAWCNLLRKTLAALCLKFRPIWIPRIAIALLLCEFVRHYQKGMKMYQVRTERNVQISNALTFMAGDREAVGEAWPGDIIGLHNYGTIQIG